VIEFTFTTEATSGEDDVAVEFRRENWNDKFGVGCAPDWDSDRIQLQKQHPIDGWTTLDFATGVFVDDTEYTVRIIFNGPDLSVEVNGVEEVSATDSQNETSTAGGRVTTHLVTNDIELAAYGYPGALYRLPITINKDDISADLTDWTMNLDQAFAAVLTQANGPLDADGTRPSLDGGGDIRFSSDEEGNSRLACDIRAWATDNTPANATCEAAVKVPAVSSSGDTIIYMWWGMTGASQPAVGDTYGQHNAYDSGHEAVWPFRDWVDRTSNEYDVDTTTAGDPTVGQAGGPLGEHAYFDGDDIRSTSATITHGIGTGPFAYEALIKRVSDTGTWDSYAASGTYEPAVYVRSGGSNYGGFWPSSGVNSVSPWPDNTNYHHAMFYRIGTVAYIRMDGAAESQTTVPTTSPDRVFRFGSGFADTGECSDVEISEFRLHTTGRSVAWWDANYHNQLNTSGFLTWGSIKDIGGAIVECFTAALELNGIQATIKAGQTVACNTAALAVAGVQAGINAASNVVAFTGTLAHSPVAANINAATKVAATTAAIVLSGIAATISNAQTVVCSTGTLALSGVQANIAAGQTVVANTGTLKLVGIQANIAAGQLVQATTATLVHSGVQSTINAEALVQAATGTLSLVGVQAAISNDHQVVAATGTVKLAGVTATILTGQTVGASTGTHGWAGVQATVLNDKTVVAATGTLVLAGVQANILVGQTVVCATGTLQLNGVAANIAAGQTVQAATGTLALAGIRATIGAGQLVPAATGTLVLAGVPATISNDQIVEAATGTLQLVGIQATVLNGVTVQASTATMKLRGIAATILHDETVFATTGTVKLNGVRAVIGGHQIVTTTTGTVKLLGVAANINAEQLVQCGTGTVKLLGAAADIITPALVGATTGTVVLRGQAANITGEPPGFDLTLPILVEIADDTIPVAIADDTIRVEVYAMTTTREDIERFRYDTNPIDIQLVDADGDPIAESIGGSTFALTVHSDQWPDVDHYAFQVLGTVHDLAARKVRFEITPEQANRQGSFWYDIRIWDQGGEGQVRLHGMMIFEPPITGYRTGAIVKTGTARLSMAAVAATIGAS
jgi:hypothetical protein